MPRYLRKSRRCEGAELRRMTVAMTGEHQQLIENIAMTYFGGSMSNAIRAAISEMGMNLGIWRRTDRRKILMDGGCVAVDRLEQRLKRHGWSEVATDYEI